MRFTSLCFDSNMNCCSYKGMCSLIGKPRSVAERLSFNTIYGALNSRTSSIQNLELCLANFLAGWVKNCALDTGNQGSDVSLECP
jgi:hypothetical protein